MATAIDGLSRDEILRMGTPSDSVRCLEKHERQAVRPGGFCSGKARRARSHNDYINLRIHKREHDGQNRRIPADVRGLRPIPMLVFRGDVSDLSSEEFFVRIGREYPEARLVSASGTGRAPTLTEPVCVAALDAFLHGL